MRNRLKLATAIFPTASRCRKRGATARTKDGATSFLKPHVPVHEDWAGADGGGSGVPTGGFSKNYVEYLSIFISRLLLSENRVDEQV